MVQHVVFTFHPDLSYARVDVFAVVAPTFLLVASHATLGGDCCRTESFPPTSPPRRAGNLVDPTLTMGGNDSHEGTRFPPWIAFDSPVVAVLVFDKDSRLVLT